MVNYWRGRRYTRTPYELRRSLRRIRSSPDIQETVIIHSDSEEEEIRINEEIRRLKQRMDDIDDEKRRLFVDLAKKYQERERVRVAREIRINNHRLRREIESRLIPRIETVARNRQDIINGARVLFNEIDHHPTELPPSYESLFGSSNHSTNINDNTNVTNHNDNHNNINVNNSNSNNNNNNNNDSDSDSDYELPDVDTIFNNL